MNRKVGLDYFPLDINFFNDMKIKPITYRFGEKGELIVIKLLCEVYKNYGYYMEWNKDTPMFFAMSVGTSTSHRLVEDVVEELVMRGFFDKAIYNSFNVLTSPSIQSRYFQAVERRKSVEVIEEYLLVDPNNWSNLFVKSLNVDIPEDNVDIVKENEYIVKQSKVKESKVKKSKVNKDLNHSPSPEGVNDLDQGLKNNINPKDKDKNKRTKEDKKALGLFEYLWSQYPLKRGKGQISLSKKIDIFKNIGEEEFLRCLDRFKKDMENQNRAIDKYPYGSTFFNSTYIDYLDKNYVEVDYKNQGSKKRSKFANFKERDNNFEELERIIFEKQKEEGRLDK